ncbi:MAG: triose-phosphate isomerase [Candidatus Woesearchaeota archaeon]
MKLILINFKTYEKGTGKKGLKLVKTIAGFKSKYSLGVCPQFVDLKEICAVKIPVFAQHLDAVDYGSNTGHVLPQSVKEAGAAGTLINHSERRITLSEIKKNVEICRRLGLISVVCAGTLSMVKKVIKFRPDYVAYEPKKLIGTNISVTDVNPAVITKAVDMARKYDVHVLCGAGVHAKKDIKKAFQLGAEGVLIAHKVVQADDPRKVLKELLG